MGSGISPNSFPRHPDEGLGTPTLKATACCIHCGHFFQKRSVLTSIFQMFRLESRSQQKCPSASTPLNPKPAALCTASAVVLRQNVRNQAKVSKGLQTFV